MEASTEHLLNYFTGRLEWGIKRLDKVKLKEPTQRTQQDKEGWENHIQLCMHIIEKLEKLIELEKL